MKIFVEVDFDESVTTLDEARVAAEKFVKKFPGCKTVRMGFGEQKDTEVSRVLTQGFSAIKKFLYE